MPEMAKVKFEYFREKLGVLHIEVPSKGSDESVSLSNMVVCGASLVKCKCFALLTWW